MSASDRPGAWRAEEKYILPPAQQAVFLHRLKVLMRPDAHAAHGMYAIHSLYFDNYDNSCYTQVLDGLNHRAKYRLRYYGQDTAHIFLEKKEKQAGRVRKTSCALSYRQALALCMDVPPFFQPAAPALWNEMAQRRKEGFRPVLCVDYVRCPLVYPAGHVRITFDSNITATTSVEQFFVPGHAGIPVQHDGQSLMEVKYTEFLPSFLRCSLQGAELHITAFSKYTLGRMACGHIR